MKRRAEYLVSKRDGRREWLRATKLARSLGKAIEAAGDRGDDAAAVEPGFAAIELAALVLEAVRRRDEMTAGVEGRRRGAPHVTTSELASMAERALWVSGRPEAAIRYAAARTDRLRRCPDVVLADRRGVAGGGHPRRRITFGHR